MKKRVISVLLAAGMIAGALAGCGGASGGASGGAAADSVAAEDLPYSGVTLTVWAANAEINDETMAVLDLATEKLGMEFEIETNPSGTEGDNIIKTKCASGELCDLSNYNSGSVFAALNPSEHFLDISDQKQLIDKIDETFLSVVSDDEGIYGVPALTSQGGAVLYYKPDYEELGLEVPKTWDEFIANCDALEAAGKTSMIGTFGDTWTSQVLFLGDNYNVISENPTFAEDFTAGTAKFASTPAAVASFEKYEDLVGRYNADYLAAKYEDGYEQLVTGQGTHWIMLTQAVAGIQSNYGEDVENIGIFAIPGTDPENVGLTVWEPNAWYINKDTENADACIAFLEFWITEEAMDMYNEIHGANGPSCVKGYELPDSVPSCIRVDMQKYFDEGKTVPALEFLTTVKGSTCEQITTEVGSGQTKGAEAAAKYDEDCKKSAVQQGLNW